MREYPPGLIETEARKTPETILLADSQELLGWISKANSIFWDHPDSTTAILQPVLLRSVLLGFNEGIVKSLRAHGLTHANTGRYDSAMVYFQKALSYAKSYWPDNDYICILNNNIGSIYGLLGDLKSAAFWYFRVLPPQRSAGPIPVAQAYANLASVWIQEKAYHKALSYVDTGISLLNRSAPQSELLPYLYLNQASAYTGLERFEEAAASCRKSLDHSLARPDLLHETYDLLASIAFRKGDTAQSMQMHRKAIREAGLHYTQGIVRSHLSLGRLHTYLGSYDSARHHLHAAMDLAMRGKLHPHIVTAWEFLAAYYDSTGDYKNGMHALKQYTTMQDSMNSAIKMQHVYLMDIRYQTVLKNQELIHTRLLLTTQQHRLERKNIIIIAFLIILCSGIFTGLLIFRNRQRIQRKNRELAVQQAILEGEEKERSRLARELHDGIGGLLATVRMYFGTFAQQYSVLQHASDYREALILLDTTLEEVRASAHNLMPELLLKHGLPEAVRIYCQNIRKTKKLNIEYQYYGFIDRLQPQFELNLYRIIQELIQNIVKHARAEKAVIQISKHSHDLNITIEDNGIGAEPALLSSGMGIQQIRKTIEHLNGSFLIVSQKQKGTNIYIEINVKSMEL